MTFNAVFATGGSHSEIKTKYEDQAGSKNSFVESILTVQSSLERVDMRVSIIHLKPHWTGH